MTQTTARIKKGSKHFEILVDLEEAMKFKKGEPSASIGNAVLTESIFHNLKSGEQASESDLEEAFGTTDLVKVSEKIIKEGEVVRTAESMKKEHDQKYKQVVDFLSKNAVSPEGRPYTPDRIMKALGEAHILVKNKPIESQINEIMEHLSKVLPIKIEIKTLKIRVPAAYTGKAYGLLKEFQIAENWQGNGDLESTIKIPQAITFDFYEKLGNITHGSAISEEIKK